MENTQQSGGMIPPQLTSFDIANWLFKEHLSGIPKEWHEKKFSQLTGELWEKTKPILLEWDFETPRICTLLGGVGIGKTHAAFCLFKKFIKNWYDNKAEDNLNVYNAINGITTDYVRTEYFKPKTKSITEGMLLAEIRNSYDKKGEETEKEILEKYSNYDILFIDEAFGSGETNFSRAKILEIINQRIEWTGKPTILTSNATFKKIGDDIDARIASRINNHLLVNVESKQPDMRVEENGCLN